MPTPLHQKTALDDPPCRLFTITQYQCSPELSRLTCWPLDRIFRQCGKQPAIEVTNQVLSTPLSSEKGEWLGEKEGKRIVVDPSFLENPPRAKSWNDLYT
ncbi:uncharacterized protein L203_105852 [Cryptococcus depauperatus CBS 7841]|uniref:Uncharacterized protein n=1 Tax=Cryptococcus depauperatus CBS 7841 TaxID=1295531 RepID=A0AAJ8JY66_9TREE